MGNRACVQFVDSHEKKGVTVYLHWNGSNVPAWLAAAAPNMRVGDSAYAAARFIGFCHEQMPGGLSLGVHNAPFDPGDNGIYRVDCSTGKVTRWRQSDSNSGRLVKAGAGFAITMGQF